jgi:hypothetical protein
MRGEQEMPHGMRKVKHKGLLIVFAIFLVLVAITLFFAFSGKSFSGNNQEGEQKSRLNFFSTKETEGEKLLKVKADLTIPNLKLSSRISKIEITTGVTDGILYSGNEKFDLSKAGESKIELTNFNGKISFDSESITLLEGKAAEVSINGISTTPQSGKTIKVSVDDNFSYKLLKIEDINLKTLAYITSGSINIDGDRIKIELNDEEIDLSNYQGNLEVKDRTFKLNGEAKKVNTIGANTLEIK